MTVQYENDLVDRLPQTFSAIQEGISRQLHTGCQLYVSHAGSVVVDCGIGQSFPGQPMTADTINPWLSAGKPLTAAAILQQWERNRLGLDDPVSKFLPQFSVGGKERVTIRHLLTHTGGFRNVETGWPDVTWDETIRRICEATIEPNWIVGRTAGYHTSTSWFILGEILSCLSGYSYAEAMHRELFAPLGLVDTWAELTPAQKETYLHLIAAWKNNQVQEPVVAPKYRYLFITLDVHIIQARECAIKLFLFYGYFSTMIINNHLSTPPPPFLF